MGEFASSGIDRQSAYIPSGRNRKIGKTRISVCRRESTHNSSERNRTS
nr:hypothetical protein [Leptospira borgpetersenii]